MKLFYTPQGGSDEIALHDLGIIYIAAQESQFTPNEAPQKETRTMTVRIQFWKDRFRDNYDLLQQTREAFRQTLGRIKWQDEDEVDDEDQPQGEGEIYLDRDVTVIEQDVPQDNEWGTYVQQITLRFRYEIDLVQASHLFATWQRRSFPVDDEPVEATALVLGKVTGFHPDFKTSYYSQLRNLRERASGHVTMTGELFATQEDLDDRREWLDEKRRELVAAIDGRDGRLIYGDFFDEVVKVEAFECPIDQVNFCLSWSISASYTRFPDEDGYAAVSFKVRNSTDEETGDVTLTLSGTIGAPTKTLALAKLDLVRTAALSDGFTAARQISREVESDNLDVDDGKTFLQITFTEVYRMRGADIESYNVVESESDDTRSGLVTRTYSGFVVATAATDSAAYVAAVNRARELGDNKHTFRMTGTLTRNDRKIGDGPQEFVRVEFSYSYQVKGTRVYLEYNAETVTETFGENAERVGGFVVARDLNSARLAYRTEVRDAFNGRLVRNESLSESKQAIGNGQYEDSGFKDTGTIALMGIRLDFSFSVFKEKAASEYAFKYGLDVENDYTALRKTTGIVGGVFVGSAADMAAALARTPGNKMDTFLTALAIGGKKLRDRRSSSEEKVGTDAAVTLVVNFDESYMDRITGSSQILSCVLTESIQHSGPRINFQGVPDGEDVDQDCGIERGQRVIRGEVVAATETVAKAWMKLMHTLPYAAGSVNGGGTPTAGKIIEYPAPSHETTWETIPITSLVPRGGGANAQFARVTFTFSWQLLSHPYVEV